jgi:hypothetical protein
MVSPEEQVAMNFICGREMRTTHAEGGEIAVGKIPARAPAHSRQIGYRVRCPIGSTIGFS